METGSTEEIEIRGAELFADLVVVVAFLDMCVECRRGSMVDSDGSHDADAPSLGFEFLGDGRQAVAVGIETEGAVGSLGACSEAGARGCGVGDTVGLGVGRGMPGVGESGHQSLYASERFSLDSRAVHLRREDLVGAHTVTDEIEDILYLRGKRQRDKVQSTKDKKTFHDFLGLLAVLRWRLRFRASRRLAACRSSRSSSVRCGGGSIPCSRRRWSWICC